MFKTIVWENEPWSLRKFVENFTLPQVIKVDEGIYSDNDTKTISSGQILTLHFTKQTDKMLVKAAEQREFLIPVNCPYKVEVLPKICEDRYYSVADILNDFPRYIRVVHDGPPAMALRAGNVLELKHTVELKRAKFLECEVQDKIRDRVRLPLEFNAAFEPLEKIGEYHLLELQESLPVRVKFTSSNPVIQQNNRQLDLRELGSVLVKEKRVESIVIASSREENIVTILTIPVDLDVSVLPARGALIGDKTYARLCKNIHDGTELEKVGYTENEFQLFEVGDCEEIDILYDYVEVKPIIPPRSPIGSHHDDNETPIGSPSTSVPRTDDSDSTSSDEYEVVDLPDPDEISLTEHLKIVSPRETIPDGNEHYYLQPSDTQEEDGSDSDQEVPPVPPRNTSLNTSKHPSQRPQHPPALYAVSRNEPARPNSSRHQTQTPRYVPFVPNAPLPNEPVFPNSGKGSSQAPAKASERPPVTIPQEFKKPRGSFFRFFKKGSSNPVHEKSENCDRSNPESLKQSNVDTDVSKFPKPSPTSTDFPDELESLSVSEVGDCLRKLNMGNYVKNFAENQIDGRILKSLDDDILTSLCVDSALHRRQLMLFIREGWRPKLI